MGHVLYSLLYSTISYLCVPSTSRISLPSRPLNTFRIVTPGLEDMKKRDIGESRQNGRNIGLELVTEKSLPGGRDTGR